MPSGTEAGGPAGTGQPAASGRATKARTGVVSIVTYNSSATVERCLDALEAAVARSRLDWRIVVVDNCSDDSTPELLRLRRQDVPLETVRNDANVGFAAAVNQSVERAQDCDLLVLVNPDCYVGEEALAVCEDWLDRHPGDAAVVQLWNVDGTVQPSAGSAWRPSRQVWRALGHGPAGGVYINRPDKRLSTDPLVVDWANMAFFAIRRQVYQDLGGLDTRFWMYCEDLDFCLRLRDAGRRVWWLPGSGAVHVGGHSSAAVAWAVQEAVIASHAEVFRKRGEWLELTVLRLGMPALYALRAARCALRGRRAEGRRHMRAALTALRLPRPRALGQP